jgi:uncharacterized protein with HEPN domain
MNKPWQPYAKHILDAVARIRRIQERGDIAQDDVLYDAALRNLQTLSEATQLLPPEEKDRYPEIPWHDISGFRNILVHNYLGTIDPVTVVGVIEQYLDPLEVCVQAMLAGTLSREGEEMTHNWSEKDDKAALKAYLENLSQAEADKVAERLGIPSASFWMRIANFRYLATNGSQGLKNYAKKSQLVWENYKKTGEL